MLTREELEFFEEDLKHFLIVNGVHGDEWEKINKEDQDRATQLVGMFSDTVLQKVYEKLRFVEHRTKTSCMVFHLRETNVDLISINAKNDHLDLSSPEGIHDALVNHSAGLTFFKSEKAYTKNREEEVHEMLMQGCVNSSESFWMQLNKALS